MKTVGDVDDADARLLQVGDDLEERLGLGHGECGGWLIRMRILAPCAKVRANSIICRVPRRVAQPAGATAMRVCNCASAEVVLTIFTGAIDDGHDFTISRPAKTFSVMSRLRIPQVPDERC